MGERDVVSLVIPVYNCERYLEACVSSVLGQSYPHLDVVLVDDGSTDGSAGLCDRLAAEDHRVRVIHQPNGGACAARNAGLAQARGSWVWFVDSDDLIEPDAVEVLLADGVRADADVIALDLVAFDDEGDKPRSSLASRPFPERSVSSGDGLEEELLKSSIGNFVCGFFYRAGFLARLAPDGLLFDPRFRLFEDVVLSHRVAAAAHRVAYEPRALYRYRQTETSAVHRCDVEVAKSGFEAFAFLKDLPVEGDLAVFRDERYCNLCLIADAIAGTGPGAAEFKKTLRRSLLDVCRRGSFSSFPLELKGRCALLICGLLDPAKAVVRLFVPAARR